MNFGDILLMAVSICTFVSYVPQIIEIIMTKEAENLSITSWILWVVSSVCYTAYAIFYQSNFLLIFETVLEGTMCIIILILSIIYRDNKKSKGKKETK